MNSKYVNISSLQTKLKQHQDKLDNNPELLNDGINAGDQFILLHFDEKEIPDPVPKEIERAATLWAAKDILISLDTGSSDKNIKIEEYKEEAKENIAKYLKDHPEEAEETKIGKFSALI